MLFLNGNTVQARPLLQSFDDDRFKIANEELWHAISLLSTLSIFKFVLIRSLAISSAWAAGTGFFSCCRMLSGGLS
jgi:hypothetical protein